MNPSPVRTGPVFEIAYSVLAGQPGYHEFLKTGDRGKFSRLLDDIAPALVAAGLPGEDVHFAKRYPPSEKRFVDEMLARLVAAGVLPHANYDRGWYEHLSHEIRTNHEHGPFRTYIYPEEAHLLFAIANVARPSSAVFLGSYYGYWAHAPLASIVRHGGRAVLVDPDPVAQEIARRNLSRAGLIGPVEVEVTTGESYLDRSEATYDFVVLDAEGPRDHPDPEQRGKSVYASLLRHAQPHMTGDALLACHNILFQDIADCSFFDGIIRRNRAELGRFMDMVHAEFPGFLECTSTEGVGAGRRSRAVKA